MMVAKEEEKERLASKLAAVVELQRRITEISENKRRGEDPA